MMSGMYDVSKIKKLVRLWQLMEVFAIIILEAVDAAYDNIICCTLGSSIKWDRGATLRFGKGGGGSLY